jgi:hypothetical protein
MESPAQASRWPRLQPVVEAHPVAKPVGLRSRKGGSLTLMQRLSCDCSIRKTPTGERERASEEFFDVLCRVRGLLLLVFVQGILMPTKKIKITLQKYYVVLIVLKLHLEVVGGAHFGSRPLSLAQDFHS